jgi:hypothetical protein
MNFHFVTITHDPQARFGFIASFENGGYSGWMNMVFWSYEILVMRGACCHAVIWST